MVANTSLDMQSCVSQKLQAAFEPIHLEVINESYQHNVLPGSESHFKVVLVSEKFENKRMLGRHREIYAILADELAGGIHALALHTYTPKEWEELANTALKSPACRGVGGVNR
ncbi:MULTISPECIES: transcriptional regulator BolA [Providencia]|uniref:DNA-binding transcriptional regulator BolA n=1 Tax=Providencia heimbachae ATCC 35613 TaxID=1354272 RepID=A0A1B7JP53_9GAMM|nr:MULTISPECIES: transcriptional regulator BolA [Providencia]MBP6123276.1 transcriptional regulator BolA [Providencia sp.]MDD9338877.1 transcriptional regulator BolA [Providencia heimbachae]NIH21451.1 transcriptional regulator BolA [Providencia heimbachae]OAT49693.1 BolA family cell division protein [Providencia heimbachae ATCC 35613]QCJ69040.1 transcriptional regulator BolA [Providencia heimbachae]